MHIQMTAEPIVLTYDDFCALPDDGRRYEILDGDLYMSPAPIPFHQRVSANLNDILRQHVRRNSLGQVFYAPVDVLLSEHNIVEPDLVYISKANIGILTDKNIKGPPDLLVEILSPSSAVRDTRDKRNIYARCGVPWYWIVDAERRSLIELERQDNAYLVTAELSSDTTFLPRLFPSLAIPLSSLWE